jgi:hypothetical protein
MTDETPLQTSQVGYDWTTKQAFIAYGSPDQPDLIPVGASAGPAAPPTLGSPEAVIATTVLEAGNWIVVSGSTATVVTSDGTTEAGAVGNAYPVT